MWFNMPGPADELAADVLRCVCPPETFDFNTTSDLPNLSGVLGQPRAVAALEFGAAIASHGFNLFALGQTGSGRTTLIREYLEKRAASQATPNDVCIVFNFADSRRPVHLLLPAGRGSEFRDDLKTLVRDLQVAIPRAFDSEAYVSHRTDLTNRSDTSREQAIRAVDQRARESGFRLLKGPAAIAIVPFIGEKPLTDEDLADLTPEQRAKVDRARERLQRELEEAIRTVRGIEKETREALHDLEKTTASFAITHMIDELRAKYRDLSPIAEFLSALADDVIENVDQFRKGKEAEPQALPFPFLPPPEAPFTRYSVNLLVDNRSLKGAPVIVESNPTYHNLTGRIEHHATFGGVFTDHTMIKAGAIHRANGGYLILPARECLMNPYAWEALKRCLKNGTIDVEELGTQLSLISTITLDPEPLPLKVKVVLIGSPMLYYLLSAYDEDFPKLFKVKAEFATRMDRTEENVRSYAMFVQAITKQDKTLPFDRGAVARIVEYGSRTAEDQERLSTRFGDIADLIREACHAAQQNSHTAVTAEDVRRAEADRRFRVNLVEERLLESIEQGTVLLDVSEKVVGRINGLAVIGMPDYSFGHPVRLTAVTGPGRRGVISIEREVEMSGPIHGKGVLILSGYLLRSYGAARTLSLSASLVFEQSYSQVEGDSASLAELLVLISALSGVPLRQNIAVTGSINQHGDVQPIGGVNEKVEGFYRVCRGRGLTGTQGVLLPAANRRHLMLSEDVIESVRAGEFHVWSAERVEQAIELLTGMPAGELQADGTYAAGTVHECVLRRLDDFAAVLRKTTTLPESDKVAAGA
jgi:lon-related putative ATP-dependent protease